MFGGAILILISDVNRCLVRMNDRKLIDASSPSKYKSRYKRRCKKNNDSTVYTTEPWSKRNPIVELQLIISNRSIGGKC